MLPLSESIIYSNMDCTSQTRTPIFEKRHMETPFKFLVPEVFSGFKSLPRQYHGYEK